MNYRPLLYTLTALSIVCDRHPHGHPEPPDIVWLGQATRAVWHHSLSDTVSLAACPEDARAIFDVTDERNTTRLSR